MHCAARMFGLGAHTSRTLRRVGWCERKTAPRHDASRHRMNRQAVQHSTECWAAGVFKHHNKIGDKTMIKFLTILAGAAFMLAGVPTTAHADPANMSADQRFLS